jgi:hypothetical protein
LRFVRPSYNNNPNLNAQKGVLSIWETKMSQLNPPNMYSTNRIPYETLIIDLADSKLKGYQQESNYPLLIKNNIPSIYSSTLLKWLDEQFFNCTRLFPGYDAITKYILEESELVKF